MKSIKLLASVAVAVAVAGLGSVLPAAASTPAAARHWTASFSLKDQNVSGDATVVSPDGGTVFVTGSSYGDRNGGGETIAYNAATGAEIWRARFYTAFKSATALTAIAVSPDGSTVFVTGRTSYQGDDTMVQAILAYNAATGAKLWQMTGQTETGFVSPVVVSPDSSTVYVTSSPGQTTAYHAATGAVAWTTPSDGTALALAPGGATLYVTGVGEKIPDINGNGAQALNARTGATLWRVSDTAALNLTMAVLSPDAATLFAIAISQKGKATVVAYAADTGGQLWAAPVTSSWGRIGRLPVMAETSSGSALILSLTRATKTTTYWQTLALNPATGATLWSTNQYNKAASLTGTGLVLSPDGSTAYVTGYPYASGNPQGYYGYYTAGYDTTTGTAVWHARYTGGADFANALSISPDGSTVFVTGGTSDGNLGAMTTVAFATS